MTVVGRTSNNDFPANAKTDTAQKPPGSGQGSGSRHMVGFKEYGKGGAGARTFLLTVIHPILRHLEESQYGGEKSFAQYSTPSSVVGDPQKNHS